MWRQYQPCIPTRSKTVPTGLQWVHEIKHDGYRIIARKIGDVVRLQTRKYDWANRYPFIVEATRALNARSAVIDGEAVVCGPDGVPDFERLHSQAYDRAAYLYAFDLLELNGVDVRPLALRDRKAKLERLIRNSGIAFSEHIEADGALVFAAVCQMGLEGIVSKRIDMPYRAGPSKMWLKIKNPKSPAMLRPDDESWNWSKTPAR
jgi:bifunctional non-homologous end joining protein LigD